MWSPDSLSLLFSSNRAGPYQLFLQRLDRGGPPARIGDGDLPTFAEDWSRHHDDVIVVQGQEGDRQLRRLSLRSGSDRGDRPAPPVPLVEDRYLKDEPHESPDGRFVAYHSTSSGRPEVYVIGVEGARWRRPLAAQVAGVDRRRRAGALERDWRRAVLSRPRRHAGASPRVGVTRVGSARVRSFKPACARILTLEQYAVARDGQRFLFALPVADPVGPVSVVINAIR